ncbi:MAG: DUF86 domain-containing protein [Fimbriimonadaceae bacterium]|uniref:DUF86 domain-containing protein n=1 Tax=Candidatus Nitrosymbiomonas proteolyticus TaxID=2608984 RepID=A0A809S654_9BACT|nr:DUF86 domain-containing protein [Fimbriimonadaceae bacterium]NUM38102.1 DUF86 domain-containing protein [Armatimonadota bacterium]BBO24516.1 conserved hypothetical protein [Candidatus Nitrosymbiomonas proteolyticus]HQU17637.1 DUF86 domain-containing protein [Fimbriimonadaceae bacterium]
MRPETAAALFDMSRAAERIAEVMYGVTLEGFRSQWIIQSAVERQFEILGEALVRVREFERPIYERIPDAAKIIGLRNIIIHGYDSVDPAILWAIVEDRLGELRALLEALLEEARKQGL